MSDTHDAVDGVIEAAIPVAVVDGVWTAVDIADGTRAGIWEVVGGAVLDSVHVPVSGAVRAAVEAALT